jgi:hypothetical protein
MRFYLYLNPQRIEHFYNFNIKKYFCEIKLINIFPDSSEVWIFTLKHVSIELSTSSCKKCAAVFRG